MKAVICGTGCFASAVLLLAALRGSGADGTVHDLYCLAGAVLAGAVWVIVYDLWGRLK